MSILSRVRSGIYEIRNTSNGHRYIGSAVNLQERWRVHRFHLGKNKHHSAYLQNAWNKYGESAFVFAVLEYCNKTALLEREQAYIDNLKPEYNMSPTAGRVTGIERSDEYRLKQSQSHEGLQAGNKNPMFGKTHSEESKRVMSENRRGIPMPLEAVARIKQALSKRYQEQGHGKLGTKQKGATSSYFGVSKYLDGGNRLYWQARLTVDRERVYLGSFGSEVEAAKAYDRYVRENNLPYPINFPESE